MQRSRSLILKGLRLCLESPTHASSSGCILTQIPGLTRMTRLFPSVGSSQISLAGQSLLSHTTTRRMFSGLSASTGMAGQHEQVGLIRLPSGMSLNRIRVLDGSL